MIIDMIGIFKRVRLNLGNHQIFVVDSWTKALKLNSNLRFTVSSFKDNGLTAVDSTLGGCFHSYGPPPR